MASTLLGVRPPHLPTRVLVGACGLFGIAPGTARVAISRMVTAGELSADDGVYRLVGALLERSMRQDASARATTLPWTPDDGWTMAVVVAEARTASERTALRRAATSARLVELREGVWLRPDNLPSAWSRAQSSDPLGRSERPDGRSERPDGRSEATRGLSPADAVLAEQCLRFTVVPDDDPATLAASLWDLAGWAARAERLLAALARTRRGLDDGDRDALPEAFVLSAAVLRHLQSDPLLPAALLPDGWPGPDLRIAHDDWRTAFDATWRSWAADPDT